LVWQKFENGDFSSERLPFFVLGENARFRALRGNKKLDNPDGFGEHCSTKILQEMEGKRNKVIFLCTGNICRSPMGEALLKRAIDNDSDEKLKRLEVISAGTSTVDGMPASVNSVAALKRIDVDISKHRSTFLTQKLVDEAYAIFAMARSHIDILKHNYKNLPPRVMTVLEAENPSGNPDIADPYGGGIDDYLDVRDEVARAIPSIVEYLKNELEKD